MKIIEVILRALFSLDAVMRVTTNREEVLMSNSSLEQEYLFYYKEWSKRYTQKHKNTQTSLSSKDVIYIVVVVCFKVRS